MRFSSEEALLCKINAGSIEVLPDSHVSGGGSLSVGYIQLSLHFVCNSVGHGYGDEARYL
jgi:hypothetical protein